MQKKFTFYARTAACSVLTFSALFINSFTTKTFGQSSCANSTVVFSETFGTGVGPASNANIIGFTYQATGPLLSEGTYRVVNDAQQKPEWHASEDGTPGNINGRMLVANAKEGDFYSHRIDRPEGFSEGNYIASLFVMNVNTPITCAPNALLPVISVKLEYLSKAGIWVPLTGSPYTAPPVAQTIDPVWEGVGSTFSLPGTDNFLVTSIRIVLGDETPGGCGNDFALDGISVAQCLSSGELPVSFLGISPRQKGNGINIQWSTSQELNSKSFVVEKSADGSSNWNVVASVNGAGNSLTVKNYNAFDPQPFKGNNFYHIKQVDIDGKFKYSKTVSVKLNPGKTAVTVLENPFHSSLSVDFSSVTSQVVSARLLDITGKQVAVEKWAIGTGNAKRDFTNVGGLQKGMYILTVSNAAGEIIYNNKVLKQ